MFHGTTIDELLEIVERVEEHAHVEMKPESSEDRMFPGFLASMNTNQVWLGVA
ncbi:MAG TPA: hypothetical protein VG897_17930 [Terriglobales bacterium]|nr:hypothetical protein [Terriglobales bacterium]